MVISSLNGTGISLACFRMHHNIGCLAFVSGDVFLTREREIGRFMRTNSNVSFSFLHHRLSPHNSFTQNRGFTGFDNLRNSVEDEIIIRVPYLHLISYIDM